MWAISISRAIGKGWAMKIEAFWGPEMATSEAIWTPKRRDTLTHSSRQCSFEFIIDSVYFSKADIYVVVYVLSVLWSVSFRIKSHCACIQRTLILLAAVS